MSCVIYTNNPQALQHFEKRSDCQVKWQGSSAMEVLETAKAAIKKGAALISDPLVGVRIPTPGAKPQAFNPYVSIVVTPPGESLDFQSVRRIDEALAVYRKNAKLRFYPHSDDAINMFQAIDMDMLAAAVPEPAPDEIN